MAAEFGRQCVVVGIDTRCEVGDYWVYQYTGDMAKIVKTKRRTLDWVVEVTQRGAGEIVLNCMNQDGMRTGYDVEQLKAVRECVTIPLVASGGAGAVEHFADVFEKTRVDGALAASLFHEQRATIGEVKAFLQRRNIAIRPAPMHYRAPTFY